MATVTTEIEDTVLEQRRAGKSFTAIAAQVGLARATEAVVAYNRALRRRPADEQGDLCAQETLRLQAMAASVEGSDVDDETRQRRLVAVERMRSLLFAD